MTRRNEEIEYLRAIAVLFVVIHHRDTLFTWKSPFNDFLFNRVGLWSGVDLFFCISGFVIARSVSSEFSRAKAGDFWKTAKAFWVRRIYRLWPSSWLWLAIPFFLILTFNRSESFGKPWPNAVSAVAAILNLANAHWYRCVANYSADHCGDSWTYWTLSLEEQFYLVFPFLFLLNKRKRLWLLAIVAAAQLPLERVHWTANLLSFMRTDGLILGVLLASFSGSEVYRLLEPKAFRARGVRWLGVTLLLIALAVCAKPEGQAKGIIPFSMGVVAMLSAVLVYLASYDQGYLMKAGLARRVLAYIGSRSFAIYLIHFPAICLTREIWFRISPPGTIFDGTYTLRLGLTALGLIALLSELNYRFIECPMREKGRRVSERIIVGI